jgi:hypothetical protein
MHIFGSKTEDALAETSCGSSSGWKAMQGSADETERLLSRPGVTVGSVRQRSKK